MTCRRLAWFAFLFAAVACKDEDSQKLETKQIDINYYVEHEDATPDSLHLQAHPYRINSLQGVDLNDGDRVEVTTNAMATPLVLKRGPIGGYFGDLPPGDHREVTFSLIRSEKTSAPTSKVATMPRIAFEEDPEGRTVSYAGAGLELRWANSAPGSEFVLNWAQPCDTVSASATTGEVEEGPKWADEGSLTIAPAQIAKTPPPDGGACYRLSIRHTLLGAIDPALGEGSTIEARQEFYFDITLVP